MKKYIFFKSQYNFQTLEKVNKKWNDVITDENRKSNFIWKALVQKKVKSDSSWRELAERRGWIQQLFEMDENKPDSFYRCIFRRTKRDIEQINCQISIAVSEPTSKLQVFQIPIYPVDEDDPDQWLGVNQYSTAIQVSNKNIFVGTMEGNIKVLNRKHPAELETTLAENTREKIRYLQGRDL